MAFAELSKRLDSISDEIVTIRRHLHENPELSFKEYKTSKYISDYHKKLGHKVRTNVGGNGVVAVLKGNQPGPKIALRADFDALPIQEENDVSYKSKVDGVMHACGHDGHTASLLGLAKVLNAMKEQLKGTIVFIHQHAEELPPGGAISMIEDGCLDGVSVIFGTHLQSKDPVGEVRYRSGPILAAMDRFDIVIQGKGGHGAQPHLTKDSIVVGGQLIGALQNIVSRKIDPLETAVLSIGTFEAKNAFNFIADRVYLSGTVRTFKEDVRDLVEMQIEKITSGICQSFDVNYEYNYIRGYPATVNHEEETTLLASVAHSVPEVESVKEGEPLTAGEDFAYYLQKVKGSYFFTGAKKTEWGSEVYPHHHPKFDIDERSLTIAAKVLGAAVLKYMDENI